MTRVAMPVDFEPLYSASPPLFKSFAHTFAEFRYAGNGGGGGGVVASCCGRSVSNPKMMMPGFAACPLRPILIVRPEALTNGHHHHPDDDDGDDIVDDSGGVCSPSDDFDGGGAPVKKKRVVFADDRGLALEHVKVMTEPSDCPPRWQDDFFEHVTRGATAAVEVERWEPVFAQPASDYVEFRRRLERDCVCLENVITREGDESVSGTVKVKNLSYSKTVTVRVSCDRWKTHDDYPCTYVPSGTEGTSLYDLYDTFSFVFPVATGASKFGCVEFCVRFRCGDGDFWDNNGGVNYKLQASSSGGLGAPHGAAGVKFDDAFTARMNTWTEFASWNHLVNDAPYW